MVEAVAVTRIARCRIDSEATDFARPMSANSASTSAGRWAQTRLSYVLWPRVFPFGNRPYGPDGPYDFLCGL